MIETMEAEGPMSVPRARSRRGPLVAAVAVGLGLALAPVAFQMFSRAPGGGDMIDAFRPYMTEAKIGGYQDQLAVIDAAHSEIGRSVVPALTDELGLDEAAVSTQFVPFATFVDGWPTIDADMGEMLRTMKGDIPNYEAVDALPPFALFPWFFVAPGLLIAGIGIAALVAARRDRATRGLLIALAVMGIGVIAAPAIFQMFTRAPKGADMIDDFRPYMKTTKLRTIQGYFVTMAAGEGNLRTAVLPALTTAPGPEVGDFVEEWPTIFRDFAPMIATMQENVENYQGVDALPPFDLFPWFFVVPGALVVLFAFAARPRRDRIHQTAHP
ncbi:MAG: hypothetical protein R6X23_09425 [Acidimicrobiia bacterium]